MRILFAIVGGIAVFAGIMFWPIEVRMFFAGFLLLLLAALFFWLAVNR